MCLLDIIAVFTFLFDFILVADAAGVATISLADPSYLTLAPRTAPTNLPAGSIDGIPEDGLDIYFSENTFNAINSAYDNNCGSPSSEACVNSIVSALSNASMQANQLQARTAPAVLGGLGYLLGVLIAAVRLDFKGSSVQVLHLSPTQLSQAPTIASATAVAALPAVGTAVTTYPLPLTPTTAASPPTISINSTSGDLHVFLTSEQADRYQSIIELPGICSDVGFAKSKRQDDGGLSCIIWQTQELVNNAYFSSAFPLRYLNGPSTIPGFEDPATESALQSLVSQAGPAAPFMSLTPANMNRTATTSFFLAYIYSKLDANLGTDNVIPGSLLSTVNESGCKDPTLVADPDSTYLACSLASCSGDPEDRICTAEPWVECPCINISPPAVLEKKPLIGQMMALQPNALMSFLTSPPQAPSPLTCFSTKYPNTPAYTNAEQISEKIESFCQTVSGGVGYTNWIYNFTYYSGTPDYFALATTGTSPPNWSTAMCNAAFQSILTGCDVTLGNLMDWKFGGSYVIGGLTYTIQPLFYNRLWPAPQYPTQSCFTQSIAKGVLGYYNITGAGWANWDFGQSSLLPAINDCIPGYAQGWQFQYYLYSESPQENGGYEWWAAFAVEGGLSPKCFGDNQVQGKAGGPGAGEAGC